MPLPTVIPILFCSPSTLNRICKYGGEPEYWVEVRESGEKGQEKEEKKERKEVAEDNPMWYGITLHANMSTPSHSTMGLQLEYTRVLYYVDPYALQIWFIIYMLQICLTKSPLAQVPASNVRTQALIQLAMSERITWRRCETGQGLLLVRIAHKALRLFQIVYVLASWLMAIFPHYGKAKLKFLSSNM